LYFLLDSFSGLLNNSEFRQLFNIRVGIKAANQWLAKMAPYPRDTYPSIKKEESKWRCKK